MAGTGIRAEVAQSRRSVSQDDAAEAQEGQQGGGEVLRVNQDEGRLPIQIDAPQARRTKPPHHQTTPD
jgi:hypothetical protein